MPEYTIAALVATVVVVVLELTWFRTGIFRSRVYWITLGICLFFMVLVNGWLTKLSAPIVLYDPDMKTPWRVPFDIPVEDYFFGFPLLTLAIDPLDPAPRRIDVDELRTFLDESMRGLEDWRFPVEYTAITGDTVVVKWSQILPGAREDGTPYVQSGYSTLVYAGDGRFSYEEDLLNMTHVLEDLAASGWRPGEGFVMPPTNPVRDFSRRSG